MSELDRLRGTAVRPLPPPGGAAAARRTARRRLGRIAAAASSALLVVTAVVAVRIGATGGADGLRVVRVPDSPPPAATSPAPAPSSASAPAPAPAAVRGAPGGPAGLPVVTGGPSAPAAPEESPVPVSGPGGSLPVTPPPVSASPPAKLPDGQNMTRRLVDRGAGACADATSSARTSYCGGVRAAVGPDRVVTVTATVCAAGANTGAARLSYPRELETDAFVLDGGQELWRWSRGSAWDAAPHTLPLRAGECYEWTAAWRPVAADGTALPPGTYDVTAVSFADELGGEDSWTTPVELP